MFSMTKISLIQHACGDDSSLSRAKAEELIRKAASEGADIVALQEFFQTIYFSREIRQEYFSLSESIPGPSTEQFTRLAKELKVVIDRKSTRLNSSHVAISYAVFCLNKK